MSIYTNHYLSAKERVESLLQFYATNGITPKAKWVPLEDPNKASHSSVLKTRQLAKALEVDLAKRFQKGEIKVAPPGIKTEFNADVNLTDPTIKGMLPSPDAAEKKAELLAKIKADQAVLAKIKADQADLKKLYDLQQKLRKRVSQAKNEVESLGGISERLAKTFQYITTNCSEFLAYVKASGQTDPLWRGIGGKVPEIFASRSRENREARDSSDEGQRVVDLALKAKGFTALRSNSIFATSDWDRAENYGTVYAIFPKNGFHYTWSVRHDDIIIDEHLDLDDDEDDVGDMIMDVMYDHEEESKMLYSLTSLAALRKDLVVKGIMKDLNLFDGFSDIAESDGIGNLEKRYLQAFITLADHVLDMVNKKALVLDAKLIDELDSHGEDVSMWQYAKTPLMRKKRLAGAKAAAEKVLRLTAELEGKKDDKSSISDAMVSKVFREFKFVKDGLESALRNGHEVCIHGEYIAILADDGEGKANRTAIERFMKALKPAKKKP